MTRLILIVKLGNFATSLKTGLIESIHNRLLTWLMPGRRGGWQGWEWREAYEAEALV